MGDGGNAYGAASYIYYKNNKFNHLKNKISNVYLGPSFGNDYVKSVLGKHNDNIEYYKSNNVTRDKK